jgi:predicted acetyltransferase
LSDIEIRVPGEEDWVAFGEAVATAFSEELRKEELELAKRVVDPTRDLAAYDGDAIVGTAGSYALTLRIPGGEVPAAGVSAVGVAPTHRRRGIMSSLLRRLHDDAHERREPIAALWAAEAAIYGRFGYGLATVNARIDADRDRTMGGLQGEATGTVRLVSKEDALDVLPPVYDRVRVSTPGFIVRDRTWWEVQLLADLEHWRNGSGPQFRAVLERDGRPEGYALYRLEHAWPEGFPGGTLHVQELMATDASAWRETWGFVFGIDLVARVKARSLATDDPLFLLAPEQARLRFRLGDGLWIRILDVARALEARTYAARESITFELEDEHCPWNAGRWRLDAESGTPAVERVGSRAELRLPAAQLAAVYLGGFTFARLERAGLVEELADGAIARADALFRTDRAPWCPETF